MFLDHPRYEEETKFMKEFIQKFNSDYLQQTPFKQVSYQVYYLMFLDIDNQMKLEIYLSENENCEPNNYCILSSYLENYRNVDELCQEFVDFINKGYYVKDNACSDVSKPLSIHETDKEKIKAWLEKKHS